MVQGKAGVDCWRDWTQSALSSPSTLPGLATESLKLSSQLSGWMGSLVGLSTEQERDAQPPNQSTTPPAFIWHDDSV